MQAVFTGIRMESSDRNRKWCWTLDQQMFLLLFLVLNLHITSIYALQCSSCKGAKECQENPWKTEECFSDLSKCATWFVKGGPVVRRNCYPGLNETVGCTSFGFLERCLCKGELCNQPQISWADNIEETEELVRIPRGQRGGKQKKGKDLGKLKDKPKPTEKAATTKKDSSPSEEVTTTTQIPTTEPEKNNIQQGRNLVKFLEDSKTAIVPNNTGSVAAGGGAQQPVATNQNNNLPLLTITTSATPLAIPGTNLQMPSSINQVTLLPEVTTTQSPKPVPAAVEPEPQKAPPLFAPAPETQVVQDNPIPVPAVVEPQKAPPLFAPEPQTQVVQDNPIPAPAVVEPQKAPPLFAPGPETQVVQDNPLPVPAAVQSEPQKAPPLFAPGPETTMVQDNPIPMPASVQSEPQNAPPLFAPRPETTAVQTKSKPVPAAAKKQLKEMAAKGRSKPQKAPPLYAPKPETSAVRNNDGQHQKQKHKPLPTRKPDTSVGYPANTAVAKPHHKPGKTKSGDSGELHCYSCTSAKDCKSKKYVRMECLHPNSMCATWTLLRDSDRYKGKKGQVTRRYCFYLDEEDEADDEPGCMIIGGYFERCTCRGEFCNTKDMPDRVRKPGQGIESLATARSCYHCDGANCQNSHEKHNCTDPKSYCATWTNTFSRPDQSIKEGDASKKMCIPQKDAKLGCVEDEQTGLELCVCPGDNCNENGMPERIRGRMRQHGRWGDGEFDVHGNRKYGSVSKGGSQSQAAAQTENSGGGLSGRTDFDHDDRPSANGHSNRGSAAKYKPALQAVGNKGAGAHSQSGAQAGGSQARSGSAKKYKSALQAVGNKGTREHNQPGGQDARKHASDGSAKRHKPALQAVGNKGKPQTGGVSQTGSTPGQQSGYGTGAQSQTAAGSQAQTSAGIASTGPDSQPGAAEGSQTNVGSASKYTPELEAVGNRGTGQQSQSGDSAGSSGAVAQSGDTSQPATGQETQVEGQLSEADMAKYKEAMQAIANLGQQVGPSQETELAAAEANLPSAGGLEKYKAALEAIANSGTGGDTQTAAVEPNAGEEETQPSDANLANLKAALLAIKGIGQETGTSSNAQFPDVNEGQPGALQPGQQSGTEAEAIEATQANTGSAVKYKPELQAVGNTGTPSSSMSQESDSSGQLSGRTDFDDNDRPSANSEEINPDDAILGSESAAVKAEAGRKKSKTENQAGVGSAAKYKPELQAVGNRGNGADIHSSGYTQTGQQASGGAKSQNVAAETTQTNAGSAAKYKPELQAVGNKGTAAQSQPGAAAESQTNVAESGTASQANVGTETDIQSGAAVDQTSSGSATKYKPELQAVGNKGTGAQSQSGSVAGSETNVGAESGAASQANVGTGTDSQIGDAVDQTSSGSATKYKPELQAVGNKGNGVQSQPGPVAGSQTNVEAESGTASQANVGTGTGSQSGAPVDQTSSVSATKYKPELQAVGNKAQAGAQSQTGAPGNGQTAAESGAASQAGESSLQQPGTGEQSQLAAEEASQTGDVDLAKYKAAMQAIANSGQQGPGEETELAAEEAKRPSASGLAKYKAAMEAIAKSGNTAEQASKPNASELSNNGTVSQANSNLGQQPGTNQETQPSAADLEKLKAALKAVSSSGQQASTSNETQSLPVNGSQPGALQSGAGTEAAAGNQAKTGSATKYKPELQAVGSTGMDAVTQPVGTSGSSSSQQSGNGLESQSQVVGESQANGDSATKYKPDLQAVGNAGTEAQGQNGAAAGSQASSGAFAESSNASYANAGAGANSQSLAAAGSQANSGSATKYKPELEAVGNRGPGAQSQSGAVTSSQASAAASSQASASAASQASASASSQASAAASSQASAAAESEASAAASSQASSSSYSESEISSQSNSSSGSLPWDDVESQHLIISWSETKNKAKANVTTGKMAKVQAQAIAFAKAKAEAEARAQSEARAKAEAYAKAQAETEARSRAKYKEQLEALKQIQGPPPTPPESPLSGRTDFDNDERPSGPEPEPQIAPPLEILGPEVIAVQPKIAKPDQKPPGPEPEPQIAPPLEILGPEIIAVKPIEAIPEEQEINPEGANLGSENAEVKAEAGKLKTTTPSTRPTYDSVNFDDCPFGSVDFEITALATDDIKNSESVVIGRFCGNGNAPPQNQQEQLGVEITAATLAPEQNKEHPGLEITAATLAPEQNQEQPGNEITAATLAPCVTQAPMSDGSECEKCPEDTINAAIYAESDNADPSFEGVGIGCACISISLKKEELAGIEITAATIDKSSKGEEQAGLEITAATISPTGTEPANKEEQAGIEITAASISNTTKEEEQAGLEITAATLNPEPEPEVPQSGDCEPCPDAMMNIEITAEKDDTNEKFESLTISCYCLNMKTQNNEQLGWAITAATVGAGDEELGWAVTAATVGTGDEELGWAITAATVSKGDEELGWAITAAIEQKEDFGEAVTAAIENKEELGVAVTAAIEGQEELGVAVTAAIEQEDLGVAITAGIEQAEELGVAITAEIERAEELGVAVTAGLEPAEELGVAVTAAIELEEELGVAITAATEEEPITTEQYAGVGMLAEMFGSPMTPPPQPEEVNTEQVGVGMLAQLFGSPMTLPPKPEDMSQEPGPGMIAQLFGSPMTLPPKPEEINTEAAGVGLIAEMFGSPQTPPPKPDEINTEVAGIGLVAQLFGSPATLPPRPDEINTEAAGVGLIAEMIGSPQTPPPKPDEINTEVAGNGLVAQLFGSPATLPPRPDEINTEAAGIGLVAQLFGSPATLPPRPDEINTEAAGVGLIAEMFGSPQSPPPKPDEINTEVAGIGLVAQLFGSPATLPPKPEETNTEAAGVGIVAQMEGSPMTMPPRPEEVNTEIIGPGIIGLLFGSPPPEIHEPKFDIGNERVVETWEERIERLGSSEEINPDDALLRPENANVKPEAGKRRTTTPGQAGDGIIAQLFGSPPVTIATAGYEDAGEEITAAYFEVSVYKPPEIDCGCPIGTMETFSRNVPENDPQSSEEAIMIQCFCIVTEVVPTHKIEELGWGVTVRQEYEEAGQGISAQTLMVSSTEGIYDLGKEITAATIGTTIRPESNTECECPLGMESTFSAFPLEQSGSGDGESIMVDCFCIYFTPPNFHFEEEFGWGVTSFTGDFVMTEKLGVAITAATMEPFEYDAGPEITAGTLKPCVVFEQPEFDCECPMGTMPTNPSYVPESDGTSSEETIQTNCVCVVTEYAEMPKFEEAGQAITAATVEPMPTMWDLGPGITISLNIYDAGEEITAATIEPTTVTIIETPEGPIECDCPEDTVPVFSSFVSEGDEETVQLVYVCVDITPPEEKPTTVAMGMGITVATMEPFLEQQEVGKEITAATVATFTTTEMTTTTLHSLEIPEIPKSCDCPIGMVETFPLSLFEEDGNNEGILLGCICVVQEVEVKEHLEDLGIGITVATLPSEPPAIYDIMPEITAATLEPETTVTTPSPLTTTKPPPLPEEDNCDCPDGQTGAILVSLPEGDPNTDCVAAHCICQGERPQNILTTPAPTAMTTESEASTTIGKMFEDIGIEITAATLPYVSTTEAPTSTLRTTTEIPESNIEDECPPNFDPVFGSYAGEQDSKGNSEDVQLAYFCAYHEEPTTPAPTTTPAPLTTTEEEETTVFVTMFDMGPGITATPMEITTTVPTESTSLPSTTIKTIHEEPEHDPCDCPDGTMPTFPAYPGEGTKSEGIYVQCLCVPYTPPEKLTGRGEELERPSLTTTEEPFRIEDAGLEITAATQPPTTPLETTTVEPTESTTIKTIHEREGSNVSCECPEGTMATWPNYPAEQSSKGEEALQVECICVDLAKPNKTEPEEDEINPEGANLTDEEARVKAEAARRKSTTTEGPTRQDVGVEITAEIFEIVTNPLPSEPTTTMAPPEPELSCDCPHGLEGTFPASVSEDKEECIMIACLCIFPKLPEEIDTHYDNAGLEITVATVEPPAPEITLPTQFNLGVEITAETFPLYTTPAIYIPPAPEEPEFDCECPPDMAPTLISFAIEQEGSSSNVECVQLGCFCTLTEVPEKWTGEEMGLAITAATMEMPTTLAEEYQAGIEITAATIPLFTTTEGPTTTVPTIILPETNPGCECPMGMQATNPASVGEFIAGQDQEFILVECVCDVPYIREIEHTGWGIEAETLAPCPTWDSGMAITAATFEPVPTEFGIGREITAQTIAPTFPPMLKGGSNIGCECPGETLATFPVYIFEPSSIANEEGIFVDCICIMPGVPEEEKIYEVGDEVTAETLPWERITEPGMGITAAMNVLREEPGPEITVATVLPQTVYFVGPEVTAGLNILKEEIGGEMTAATVLPQTVYFAGPGVTAGMNVLKEEAGKAITAATDIPRTVYDEGRGVTAAMNVLKEEAGPAITAVTDIPRTVYDEGRGVTAAMDVIKEEAGSELTAATVIPQTVYFAGPGVTAGMNVLKEEAGQAITAVTDIPRTVYDEGRGVTAAMNVITEVAGPEITAVTDIPRTIYDEGRGVTAAMNVITEEVGPEITAATDIPRTVYDEGRGVTAAMDVIKEEVGAEITAVTDIPRTVYDEGRGVTAAMNEIKEEAGPEITAATGLPQTVYFAGPGATAGMNVIKEEVGPEITAVTDIHRTVYDEGRGVTAAMNEVREEVGVELTAATGLPQTVYFAGPGVTAGMNVIEENAGPEITAATVLPQTVYFAGPGVTAGMNEINEEAGPEITAATVIPQTVEFDGYGVTADLSMGKEEVGLELTAATDIPQTVYFDGLGVTAEMEISSRVEEIGMAVTSGIVTPAQEGMCECPIGMAHFILVDIDDEDDAKLGDESVEVDCICQDIKSFGLGPSVEMSTQYELGQGIQAVTIGPSVENTTLYETGQGIKAATLEPSVANTTLYELGQGIEAATLQPCATAGLIEGKCDCPEGTAHFVLIDVDDENDAKLGDESVEVDCICQAIAAYSIAPPSVETLPPSQQTEVGPGIQAVTWPTGPLEEILPPVQQLELGKGIAAATLAPGPSEEILPPLQQHEIGQGLAAATLAPCPSPGLTEENCDCPDGTAHFAMVDIDDEGDFALGDESVDVHCICQAISSYSIAPPQVKPPEETELAPEEANLAKYKPDLQAVGNSGPPPSPEGPLSGRTDFDKDERPEPEPQIPPPLEILGPELVAIKPIEAIPEEQEINPEGANLGSEHSEVKAEAGERKNTTDNQPNTDASKYKPELQAVGNSGQQQGTGPGIQQEIVQGNQAGAAATAEAEANAQAEARAKAEAEAKAQAIASLSHPSQHLIISWSESKDVPKANTTTSAGAQAYAKAMAAANARAQTQASASAQAQAQAYAQAQAQASASASASANAQASASANAQASASANSQASASASSQAQAQGQEVLSPVQQVQVGMGLTAAKLKPCPILTINGELCDCPEGTAAFIMMDVDDDGDVSKGEESLEVNCICQNIYASKSAQALQQSGSAGEYQIIGAAGSQQMASAAAGSQQMASAAAGSQQMASAAAGSQQMASAAAQNTAAVPAVSGLGQQSGTMAQSQSAAAAGSPASAAAQSGGTSQASANSGLQPGTGQNSQFSAAEANQPKLSAGDLAKYKTALKSIANSLQKPAPGEETQLEAAEANRPSASGAALPSTANSGKQPGVNEETQLAAAEASQPKPNASELAKYKAALQAIANSLHKPGTSEEIQLAAGEANRPSASGLAKDKAAMQAVGNPGRPANTPEEIELAAAEANMPKLSPAELAKYKAALQAIANPPPKPGTGEETQLAAAEANKPRASGVANDTAALQNSLQKLNTSEETQLAAGEERQPRAAELLKYKAALKAIAKVGKKPGTDGEEIELAAAENARPKPDQLTIQGNHSLIGMSANGSIIAISRNDSLKALSSNDSLIAVSNNGTVMVVPANGTQPIGLAGGESLLAMSSNGTLMALSGKGAPKPEVAAKDLLATKLDPAVFQSPVGLDSKGNLSLGALMTPKPDPSMNVSCYACQGGQDCKRSALRTRECATPTAMCGLWTIAEMSANFKAKIGDTVRKTCFYEDEPVGCQKVGKFERCLCQGNLCNVPELSKQVKVMQLQLLGRGMGMGVDFDAPEDEEPESTTMGVEDTLTTTEMPTAITQSTTPGFAGECYACSNHTDCKNSNYAKHRCPDPKSYCVTLTALQSIPKRKIKRGEIMRKGCHMVADMEVGCQHEKTMETCICAGDLCNTDDMPKNFRSKLPGKEFHMFQRSFGELADDVTEPPNPDYNVDKCYYCSNPAECYNHEDRIMKCHQAGSLCAIWTAVNDVKRFSVTAGEITRRSCIAERDMKPGCEVNGNFERCVCLNDLCNKGNNTKTIRPKTTPKPGSKAIATTVPPGQEKHIKTEYCHYCSHPKECREKAGQTKKCTEKNSLCATYITTEDSPKFKVKAGDVTRRGCHFEKKMSLGCHANGKFERCICEGDNCNKPDMPDVLKGLMMTEPPVTLTKSNVSVRGDSDSCYICNSAKECRENNVTAVKCFQLEALCATWIFLEDDAVHDAKSGDIARRICHYDTKSGIGCKIDGKYEKCVCEGDACNTLEMPSIMRKLPFIPLSFPNMTQSVVSTTATPKLRSYCQYCGNTTECRTTKSLSIKCSTDNGLCATWLWATDAPQDNALIGEVFRKNCHYSRNTELGCTRKGDFQLCLCRGEMCNLDGFEMSYAREPTNPKCDCPAAYTSAAATPEGHQEWEGVMLSCLCAPHSLKVRHSRWPVGLQMATTKTSLLL